MIESLFSKISTALNAWHRIVFAILRWMGLLVGIFPKAGRVPPAVYVVIHYGLILLITGFLAYNSTAWIKESDVDWPWPVPRFYVGIQFLLVYLFIRLLIAGVQLFLTRDLSEFEDVQRAWESGLDALAREGFDLQWLPIFLVNGATPEQQKSLFEGSRMTWKVNGNSDDPRSNALTFHASDEALFICLNDVGAMSRQLKKVPSRGGNAATAARTGPAIASTMRPDQLRSAVEQTRRPDQLQNAGGQTLPPNALAAAAGATMRAPAAQYGATMRPGEIAGMASQTVAPVSVSMLSVLEKLSKDELRQNHRRLEFVCQLLTEERGSYCPLNGLLQLIPLRWTESAAHEPLMAAAAADIQTLHNGLHLQFPVVCVHAGLEDVTGLSEFIERGKEIDSRFRDSRAGSRYPAGLAVDHKSSEWVVERGLIWFRDWVYAEFAKNLASSKNRQLYQFLCSLSLRRERLVRELQTVIGDINLRQPVRLTGCYFAATGAEPAKQAFVHGVMQRLMSEQNDVAWLPEWRSRDRRCLLLTSLVSLVTLAVLAADVYLVWQIWQLAPSVLSS
ncbi:type VI secretion protein IcmF/TssM N-terminal domain-containing protein [Schlesneria paludicola]|uniref:type VI secretion protein IcmF/TssM N-terminal domain-containing protein n=1 Tax=Schlesneria paludicola TaxID=360056 RepID=UPI00029B56D8|nr:type VI secretion protein IcmF/TssM N-terminal domain-containing protein [Schlesneria paludicola]